MQRPILTTLLFAAFAMAGCTTQPDTDRTASLAETLTSTPRYENDAERDSGRKPAAVLAYLGVEPGMTVLDVMASGGWYTEVLSLAVGPGGKVYAQNPPAFLQFRDGFYDKAITARLAGNRLSNVERLDSDFGSLGLDGQVDVAISALNFHDIYNRSPEAATNMLRAIRGTLKPGGVFGIIDHDGDAGADNAGMHRMTMAQAVEAAEAAGFTVSTSDLLRSATDDHTKMVFSPEVRGQTDRFLLKLTNP